MDILKSNLKSLKLKIYVEIKASVDGTMNWLEPEWIWWKIWGNHLIKHRDKEM